VARFVGSPAMNVLPFDTPLAPEGLPAGRPIELGVRPEHVRLGIEGAPGEVTLVEPVGSEAFVHVRVGGSGLVARTNAATRPDVGAPVRVAVRRQEVHLFDAETGERVPWT